MVSGNGMEGGHLGMADTSAMSPVHRVDMKLSTTGQLAD
jgi:hypothetical protein